MKKQIIAFLGICSFSLMLLLSSNAFGYSKAQELAYQWAYQKGITTQPNVEKANLDGNITRQAMAKMIVNYALGSLNMEIDPSKTCNFTDEESITPDLRIYAKKACVLGLMGKNGTDFRPMQTVTRAQFGTLLSRILWGDRYNKDGDDYYVGHLNALKRSNVLKDIENPKERIEKRGDIMLMLMAGESILLKKKGTSNKDVSYITEEELINLIAKEEGVNENDLKFAGSSCDDKECTYYYSLEKDGKTYLIKRLNIVGEKSTKILDIGIEQCEKIALKDSGLTGNYSIDSGGYWVDKYKITITREDGILEYKISLDGAIQAKKRFVSGETALKSILSYLKMESKLKEIKKDNDNICKLGSNENFICSFNYDGSSYFAYVDANNGNIIPIKKNGDRVTYGDSVKDKVNVVITRDYSNLNFISEDEALDLALQHVGKNKNNINWNSFIKIGEGENRVYMGSFGLMNDSSSTEYCYVDALFGSWVISMTDIINIISDDTNIPTSGIAEGLNDLDDSLGGTKNTPFLDPVNNEYVILYGFNYEGKSYIYKISLKNGKILDSKKIADIGKNNAEKKAYEYAKKQYSKDLNQEQHLTYYRSDYYREYLKLSGKDFPFGVLNESEYVVIFQDNKNTTFYRVFVDLKGNILKSDSADKKQLERSGYEYILYVLGYNLADFSDLDYNDFEKLLQASYVSS